MAIRESYLAPAPKTLSHPLLRLREFLNTLLRTLFIGLALMIFVAQPTRVEGVSMEPTLQTGQQLVIEKISYRFQNPTHGDIVVIKLDRSYNPYLVKRVIATEGDVVEIRNGRLYLNGQMQEEKNITSMTSRDYATTVVPPGHLFVLGDNRDASNDSRYFGMVPIESLVGRALASYWPPNTIGPIN